MAFVRRSKDNSQELVLYFHHESQGLGSSHQHLYLLSHLTFPISLFFQPNTLMLICLFCSSGWKKNSVHSNFVTSDVTHRIQPWLFSAALRTFIAWNLTFSPPFLHSLLSYENTPLLLNSSLLLEWGLPLYRTTFL